MRLGGGNKADIRRLAEAYVQASAILYSIIETAPAVVPFVVLLNNPILHPCRGLADHFQDAHLVLPTDLGNM